MGVWCGWGLDRVKERTVVRVVVGAAAAAAVAAVVMAAVVIGGGAGWIQGARRDIVVGRQ